MSAAPNASPGPGAVNDDNSNNNNNSLFHLNLTADGYLILFARFIRMFSYGWIAVALVLYLVQLGLSQWNIGVLFTTTLLGDLIVTFYLTTTADNFGRRTTLLVGSALKVFAGATYAFQSHFIGLLIAGMIGIISPTGGEIGPFLAVEQSSLTESISKIDEIPKLFGWYQLIGYFAQAMGALASGWTITTLEDQHLWSSEAAYRFIIIGYGCFGIFMFIIYWFLSSSIEPLHARESHTIGSSSFFFSKFGLHREESKRVVLKLSALFILDAFAGGFVMQSIIVFWYHEEYQMNAASLGMMMMGANIFAGISALAATPLVNKIGAIETMVFTHFPSNILLLMIPFMPNARAAIIVLLLRFSISQMDVPARQTYVAMVVDADERSAAGGITSIVRSVGLSLSPLLCGYLLADPNNTVVFALPFIIAGGLKCLYDVLLYYSFKHAPPKSSDGAPGEAAPAANTTAYTRVGVSQEEVRSQNAAAPDTDLYDEDAYEQHK